MYISLLSYSSVRSRSLGWWFSSGFAYMTSILRRAFISISLWRFGGVLAREADAKRVLGDGKGGAFRRTHPWGMPVSPLLRWEFVSIADSFDQFMKQEIEFNLRT